MTLVSTVTAIASSAVGADLRLEQVAEHVDAGAHFGHAVRDARACSAVGELPIETIGTA